MSTSEPHPGWSLPRSLIDAGLLSHPPLPTNLEQVQQDLQVPVKLNQQRISPKLLEDCVLSSTVQTKSLRKWWTSCSKDWLNKVHGLVSMSSTESISKFCQLLLSNFWSSEWLSSETDQTNHFSLMVWQSLFYPTSVSLSPWTQVTQEEHNSQTTWSLSSDLSVWWSQIMPWSLKSCFSQKDSKTQVSSAKKWSNSISFLLSSSLLKTITISVWEPSSLCWSWPVH